MGKNFYERQRDMTCTPACAMYCMVLLKTDIPALCEGAVMQSIMRSASEVYEKMPRAQHETILQQHEVIEFVDHRREFVTSELFATNGQDISGFPSEVIDVTQLLSTIPAGQCLLLTAGNHTTALVNKDGYFHFDPLVASVQAISNNAELLPALRHSHGKFLEMTVTKIATAQAEV